MIYLVFEGVALAFTSVLAILWAIDSMMLRSHKAKKRQVYQDKVAETTVDFLHEQGERMTAQSDIDPWPKAHNITLDQKKKLLLYISKAFDMYELHDYAQAFRLVEAPLAVIQRRHNQFASNEIVDPDAQQLLTLLEVTAVTIAVMSRCRSEADAHQTVSTCTLEELQNLEKRATASAAFTKLQTRDDSWLATSRLCQCLVHAACYEYYVLTGESVAAARELVNAAPGGDIAALQVHIQQRGSVWDALASKLLLQLHQGLPIGQSI